MDKKELYLGGEKIETRFIAPEFKGYFNFETLKKMKKRDIAIAVIITLLVIAYVVFK